MDTLDQVAALQMSARSTPRSRAVDVAMARVEWPFMPTGGFLPAASYAIEMVDTSHLDRVWEEAGAPL